MKIVTCEGAAFGLKTIVYEDSLEPALRSAVDSERGPGAWGTLKVESVDVCRFDGGGMLFQGEVRAEVEVAGVRFACRGREVEMLLPLLRTTRPHQALGEAIVVSGPWHRVAISRATALALADALERWLSENAAAVEQVWNAYDRLLGDLAPKPGDNEPAVMGVSRNAMRARHGAEPIPEEK